MTATAAARALENFPAAESIPAGKWAVPEPAAEPAAQNHQGTLFREGLLVVPKVIPIPTLTPSRALTQEHPIRRVPARAPQRPKRTAGSQQALQFTALEERSLETQADQIYCDAPVALPGHRLLAAAVDASMVLIGLGIFLLIFFLGGDLVINRQTAPFLIAVGAVIALFYHSLWYFGNGDTPGMRFAGLRLVDFDGRRPDREQRGIRQAASLLSLLAAGLGLVWALVDEENLTWHDHISKTFPTTG